MEIHLHQQNEKVRLSSSSGGIFYSLSKKVIEEKGVVFGAAFDVSFDVKHILYTKWVGEYTHLVI